METTVSYYDPERPSVDESEQEPECPRFVVDVEGDVLLLKIPAQALPENRGFINPHIVQARLRSRDLELELYGMKRKGRVRRPYLVSVGVWSLGGYVYWRDERVLDFLVLDAVDLCLRKQLPPGGGVPTFKRLDLLASAAGVSFRA